MLMKNHKISRLFIAVALLALTLVLVPFDAFSQSKSAKLKNDKKTDYQLDRAMDILRAIAVHESGKEKLSESVLNDDKQ